MNKAARRQSTSKLTVRMFAALAMVLIPLAFITATAFMQGSSALQKTKKAPTQTTIKSDVPATKADPSVTKDEMLPEVETQAIKTQKSSVEVAQPLTLVNIAPTSDKSIQPSIGITSTSTLINSNFDSGSFAGDGWTVANGAQTNKWFVGTVAGNSGGGVTTNAAYISDNVSGTTYNYNITSTSVVHFYRDVTFPAGETVIKLSFDWKGNGESTFDDLGLFIVSTSTTPTAGTSFGAGQLVSGGATYQTANFTISPTLAGTTQRLVFSWRNDNTTGTQPPAAIDNIVLTSSTPSNITSTATGNWSSAATWAGGVVPSSGDNVTIADGTTVTIDTSPSVNNLTVGQGTSGILQYEQTTARTLTVAGNATVSSGGTFRSNTAGTVTTHSLAASGNLTNNGTLDFSTNANTAGAGITFTGAANNTFGGIGATTDVRTITINKGTSNASILELNPTAFTVQGVSADGTAAAYLTLTNGTFKVSGTFTSAFRTFTTAGYIIGATTGFWLNNPNYTVSGQNGSPTNNGLLRISQGTFNVGTSSGNAMGSATAGAVFTIEGGTANFTGRLNPTVAVTYTQSAGTVNVCTVGCASSSNASFGLASASTVFNMSGGTINLVQASTAVTPFDYQVSGTANITGGTLNVGTAATVTNFNFRIRGQVPALVINNTTNNKTATLIAQANVWGDTTVSSGTTLNLGGFLYLQIGTNFVNNGTVNGTTAGSRLYFLGSAAQTYSGSGVVTAPLDSLDMDNPNGLTLTSTNQITATRVDLFRGTITNSNKITLGNGGTTSATTQIGVAASTSPGGSFDVNPTFNIGSGGYTILYLQESVARTTGFEIPSSRNVNFVTVNNTNGLILNGNLNITGTTGTTLALTNGTVTIGSNTINISSGGTITQSGTGAIASGANGGTVSFLGTGTIAGTLTFNNLTYAGGITFGAASTIGSGGTLTVNTGGFVSSGTPIYSNTSTLKYNTGGTYGRNGEWLPNVTSGAGYPNNVQLSNNTTLNLPSGSPGTPFQMAGTLTIDSGSTMEMAGGSPLTQPLTVLGSVIINGTLRLSSASGGDIKIVGNWTRSSATGTFTPNGRAVFFNGTGAQTITVTPAASETFNYLIIDKSAGTMTLNNSPATSVLVNATAGDVLQLLTAANLDLNGQSLTMQNNGGNLLTSGGVHTISNGNFSFTGSKTVTGAGGGTLVFGTNANVFLLSAVDFGSSLSTINGTLNINSGGSVNTNPPTYGNASTLVYDCNCVYGRNTEWSATSGPGYPNNVTVNASTDVNIGNNTPAVARQIAGTLDAKNGGNFLMDHPSQPMTATLTVLGNVLIETGGSLHLSTSPGGDLVTQGNFTINGTFTHNNRAVFFTGGNTQTVNAAISPLTIPYVRINKSGNSVTLGNTDVTTLGPSGGDSIQFTGTTSTLTLNGRQLTLGSTIGGISPGSGFIGSNASKMSLQDGGTAGAMGTLVFVSGSEFLQNLTMNRTGALGTVALGSPLSISGTLTLTNGIITTGVNTLTLTDTASAARTSGYVTGNYKKIYAETGSFTYDVGTANGYSPMTANVTGGTLPASLTVKPTQTAQPQIQTPAKALQRYWTLTEGGDLTADLTFSYLDPPDVPGTANETAFIVFKYDGANFTTPTGVVDFLNNKFTVPAVSSFSDWTLAEAIAPTAVKLVNFDATSDNGLVRLDWNTGYEARNLGFNVYREQNGKRTRVTPSMLAGSALLTGPRSVLTAGHSYTWFDAPSAQESRTGPAQYWLEDVDINGTRTLHGPVTPSIAKTPVRQTSQREAEVLGQRQPIGTGTGLQINGWPTAAASNQGEAIALRADRPGTQGAQQVIQPGRQGSDESAETPAAGTSAAGNGAALPLPSPSYIEPDTAVSQRQIADMPGVKFNVSRNGWYRITQPELIAAGLNPNVNASHLQLFAGGIEVPIRVSGNGQGLTASDVIEFYGTGAELPTDGTQTYYLVQGQSYGKRIMKFVDKDAPPVPAPSGPASFNYTLERKERLTFFPGLDNGEADNFFGQIITNNNASPVLENLNVKHPYTQSASGAQAQLEVSLQGVTSGSHTVRVVFNGTDAGVINFAGTEHILQSFDVPASSVREGDNVIQLSSLGGEADISLADTVRLTYAHAYAADNDTLALSVNSEDTVRVNGFNSANIRVVDITDANNSQELTPVINAQPDGSFSADAQVIGAHADEPHTLIVFADNEAAQPESVRNSNPSHWASEDAGADFLIISHRSLMGSVQPLADLRRSQGMQVDVIDVEDIYDEFSFGAHSPQAIREFIKRAANSWKVSPRYVLLVGDATYDPRNYLGQGANDMIPTKLLWATDMKTASDDWMADMDGNGVAELAVGRLPVRTASEANILVNKIVNYVPGQSAQGALLVADHASGNDFEGASSALGQQLPASVPVSVVNRGTQDANTVRSQIIGNINQGPQVVNYFGHGSVGLWTGAGLLTTGDAANLQNGNRLPLFTMMTCLNGYFQDVSGDSLAEALLKAQNGGAVAVWASSGQTNMEGQSQAAQSLYQLIFGGQPMTLGDAVKAAKSATNDQNVRRSWIFFGDPTQRIR